MKISKVRLKEIIQEEMKALKALAENRAVFAPYWAEHDRKVRAAELHHSGEEEKGLKSKLFTSRTGGPLGGAGDARMSALGGRTMQPGEELDAGFSPAEARALVGDDATIDASERSQDAGLYMSQGRFDPTDAYEAKAVGMFSPEEMAASKIVDKKYSGKDIPDFMRAGYKGEMPEYQKVSSGGLNAAKTRMRDARKRVKTELSKPENEGKSIYGLPKTEGSARAEFAAAYTALKRAKAGKSRSIRLKSDPKSPRALGAVAPETSPTRRPKSGSPGAPSTFGAARDAGAKKLADEYLTYLDAKKRKPSTNPANLKKVYDFAVSTKNADLAGEIKIRWSKIMGDGEGASIDEPLN